MTEPPRRGKGAMQPLATMPRDNVRGVLTDIDDTLTTHGRLTADAYRAMERLHDAGLMVMPMPAVSWSSRPNVRSMMARGFHRLANTALMPHCTVLGLTLSLVTTPSFSLSIVQEKSGLSALAGSMEKLS